MYIFPMLETQEAIKDHVNDPENVKKLLHVESLLIELLNNIKQEVFKRGLSRRIQQKNSGDK